MRDFDWQILVTLHQTKSITKTAELLFLTQPALTKRIQAIESELGTTLVVRGRKGSYFTPEGERIARKAERVVASIQEIRDLAALTSDGGSGILRLGFPYSMVRYALPEVMKKYTSKHPGVMVDIHAMQSAELIRNVENGILDVCFSRYLPEDSHLEHRLFSTDRSCVICSRPFELDELPEMPYIDYPKNQAMEDSVRRWWDERFTSGQNTQYHVSTIDACISMVQHGLGYGIALDERCLQHESGLFSRPLTLSDGTNITQRTWIIYRKESIAGSIVKNFLSAV